ncbi:putative endonuclease [Flavobacteriaceae bacterium MAR_2010_188]|nr:putative endonuclease [Flavobacteriaceae bacterium MAR_2010_188]
MYYIYAMSSKSRNYIYVGLTKDCEARIKRHNGGREKTTKPYRPFELIFLENIDASLEEARRREKYWKSGVGKDRLRYLRDNSDTH